MLHPFREGAAELFGDVGIAEQERRLEKLAAVQSAAQYEMTVEESPGFLKTLNNFLVCHDIPSICD